MIFLLLIPQLLGDNTCGIEHCQICDDYARMIMFPAFNAMKHASNVLV